MLPPSRARTALMLSSTCRVCSRIVRDGDLARNEEHGAPTQIDADGVGEDGRDARALEGVDATRRLPGEIDAGPFHGREDTAVVLGMTLFQRAAPGAAGARAPLTAPRPGCLTREVH